MSGRVGADGMWWRTLIAALMCSAACWRVVKASCDRKINMVVRLIVVKIFQKVLIVIRPFLTCDPLTGYPASALALTILPV